MLPFRVDPVQDFAAEAGYCPAEMAGVGEGGRPQKFIARVVAGAATAELELFPVCDVGCPESRSSWLPAQQ